MSFLVLIFTAKTESLGERRVPYREEYSLPEVSIACKNA